MKTTTILGWEILQCRECESRCKLVISLESLQDPHDFPEMCIFKGAEIKAKWTALEGPI